MDFDLLSIGTHCSVKSCNQLDYLPFTCPHCKAATCKEHREDHACPSAPKSDQATRCPTCQSFVRAGSLLKAHLESGCTAHILAAHKTAPRCSKPGCKARDLMPVTCPGCRATFCLRHRFPGDHAPCHRPQSILVH
eukprot:m.247166 g.247166  ORF g.247166 m.247166 type:complete len:136 (+) comp15311_c0_seq1:109-516(+)